MSKITIEIRTDTAAFEDSGLTNEVARILRSLESRIDQWDRRDDLLLRDANGNRVGFARYASDMDESHE